MKKISFLLLLICFVMCAKAQNIFPSTGSTGIGTATPNASAILEIKSTTKGMLVPRMTKALRDAIAAPATGLLIYQTNNTPGFYYYSGTAWTAVSSVGANTSLSNLKSAAININLLPDTTNMRNLGSTSVGWKNIFYTGSLYSGSNRILSTDVLYNTFLGISAGNTTGTGNSNTAVGSGALASNTTGYLNTANGVNALMGNSSGYANTATGASALSSNLTGVNNSATGNQALTSNIGGGDNTATGNYALRFNTYGGANTATGSYALRYNTNGGNSAFGFAALDNSTSGSYNVAVGYLSLENNTTGSYNTGIGTYAGFPGNANDNTTAIGYGAANDLANNSNFVAIGNASVTTIGGQVGWSSFSDGRVKDNIKKDVPGLVFINKLNPVTYNFNIHRQNEMMMKGRKDSANWKGKYDIEKKKMTGFVAQEVEKAADDLGYDFSGVVKPGTPDGLYALRYSDFVVPLVKAVQELSKIDDDQKSVIIDLKNENSLLEQRVTKLEAMMNAQSPVVNNAQQSISFSGAALEQNSPNPFSTSTTIHYTLPQSRNIGSSAQIIISDKLGKVIKQVTLSGNGKGVVTVDAATLSSGAYQYSLYVNTRLIDTKQMILNK